MKNICIIPARGGSKRIPRKNIKEFCGKPIIEYSIEAASKSGLFSDIIVSTDDEDIASISKKAGASVPFMRSEENSGDFATTVDVLVEVLERLGEECIGEVQNVCCIYPTAPLLRSSDIIEAYKILGDNFSVIPIVPFSYPPQRGIICKPEGSVSYWKPENEKKRSQDLETIYHDVGQFYWVRVRSLINEKRLVFQGRTAPFFMDEIRIQDLDNLKDWEIAEFKFNYLESQ